MIHRIEVETRSHLRDALAEQTRARLASTLGRAPRAVARRAVYHLDLDLSSAEAEQVATALVDPVTETGGLGALPDDFEEDPPLLLTIGFRPGVTDNVGTSVKRAAQDRLGRSLVGRCYSSTMWIVWGVGADELAEAARQVLYNPLIEHAEIVAAPHPPSLEVPRAGTAEATEVRRVPLRGLDDAALEALSLAGTLALDRVEMRAIAEHFRALDRDPTDAELECIAQTWSEHCKHKIFSAPIDYVQPDGSTQTIEDGLFKTYVRGATLAVARARGEGIDGANGAFLVSVFHDNAGVVRFTERDHLVYKVETHNSPSALDPYGGAMTGIVGVNRDSFGTGLGADLLTNVWGYCFADPSYAGRVPSGLMHPSRLREGVHRGVIDGGNQSGIPYSRGFELFDDRFLGKPLVFCGTVAAMPVETAGRPTHVARIEVGHLVVMVGGRIGKDGIHGATFSSVELNEDSPVQAVQIGDPITQKMMFDMLAEARDAGLIAGMTDNGAGGLSSSVGEMAEATDGARIDLALAPLKYPGLAPWEILISEAQERMTLAIAPDRIDAFLDLARRREVEATVLGEFTDDGRLVVHHGETQVVDLPLAFLHDGLPRTRLRAELTPGESPRIESDAAEALGGVEALGGRWMDLLAASNLAVDERMLRHYDHEVKGLSVVKPLLGRRRDVPATATVMRVRHHRPEGVILGEGVHPHVTELDAFEMAQRCVDEGVRRVLCAGARIDRLAALDNFCWPDPVLSAKTPDGPHKLAQLVECCRGLRGACETFGLPLVSGKDSMKNDATLDGVKISIPPTLLVSVMGQTPDVADVSTLVPRHEGDDVWLLRPVPVGLGGTEFARVVGLPSGVAPRADLSRVWRAYQAFCGVRDRGRVASAHVCGRGGLATALAHMALASEHWLEIECTGSPTDPFVALFGEGCGSIVLTADPGHGEAIRTALDAFGLTRLGRVGARSGSGGIRVRDRDVGIDLQLTTAEMRRRSMRPLSPTAQ